MGLFSPSPNLVKDIPFQPSWLRSTALGAFSSNDTAPAPGFKGVQGCPLLLVMNLLFNALTTADAILVSASADRSSFLLDPVSR